MHRSVPAAVVAACLLALPATTLADDFAGTALNVVPSGQWGGAPVPPGADSQAKLYDALTPRFDQVNADDLTRSFKSERFGVGPDGPATTESVPRKGVRIVRDRYHVPHINGSTRDDLTWAMGWVLEEDRGLLLAQGARPGAPGGDRRAQHRRLRPRHRPQDLHADTRGRPHDPPQRDAGAALRRARTASDCCTTSTSIVAGINARLRAEKSTAKRFTRVDLYAVNALVGQIFGEGGGGEDRRSQLLGALRKRLGKGAGQTLFDDLSRAPRRGLAGHDLKDLQLRARCRARPRAP